jgi:hypothetical protein
MSGWISDDQPSKPPDINLPAPTFHCTTDIQDRNLASKWIDYHRKWGAIRGTSIDDEPIAIRPPN